MARISVIILTHNEELHLERAIQSVSGFADTVHIIDSGSTDRTREIAEELGAEVLSHPWTNYAHQFEWGVNNITSDADWIMRLDADEIIEPDLAAVIRDQLPGLGQDVVGINIDRKHIFLGRWIRHGGRYPLTLLRIFRRGKGRIEQRWMDEHIIVEGGEVVHFAGGFADVNLKDLTFFTAKHNQYATREAVDALNQKYALFPRDIDVTSQGTSLQAAFKRFVKERVYNRIPFTLSSLAYFLFRYIFQLGFLDGREGLVYHFLQGYWYRFLVGAKVMEFDRVLAPLQTREERISALRALTGLAIEG